MDMTTPLPGFAGAQPGSLLLATRRGLRCARVLAEGRADARPACQSDGYSTGGPNGPRSMISMRVPQGSVMYVMVLPVGVLRAGSSSLMPSASIFFTKAG